MQKSWRKMTLPANILQSLATANFLVPTELQLQSVPHLLQTNPQIYETDKETGEQVLKKHKLKSTIVLGECGSGKTLAFVLPMLARANQSQSLQGLIVAPTVAMAVQIHLVAKQFTQNAHLLVGEQVAQLPKNTDIAITTMHALESDLKHLHQLLFKGLKTVAFDEMDLQFGESQYQQSVPVLESLLQHAPQANFIFTCATLPEGPRSARRRINIRLPQTSVISSAGSHKVQQSLTQQFIKCQTDDQKNSELINMIKEQGERPMSILVFCNDVARVDAVYEALSTQLSSRCTIVKLHSRVPKSERVKILQNFNNDRLTCVHVLVAADAVSRGHDFSGGVDRVVQYDCASNMVTMMHRMGRTARNGQKGECVHLVAPADHLLMDPYEAQVGDLSSLFSRKRSLRDKFRRQHYQERVQGTTVVKN